MLAAAAAGGGLTAWAAEDEKEEGGGEGESLALLTFGAPSSLLDALGLCSHTRYSTYMYMYNFI